jgi:hypothetical protein
MKLHKIIQRRIRKQHDGVSLASDVNVAVSGNVGERGATTKASSRQVPAEEKDAKKKSN